MSGVLTAGALGGGGRSSLQLCQFVIHSWFPVPLVQCARMGGGLLEALLPDQLKVSLIVNLYSDEEGYSVMLPKSGSEETQQQEVFMPYTDTDLLDYLDANEVSVVVLSVFSINLRTQQTTHCLA